MENMVERATDRQVELGRSCGLSLNGKSRAVAGALLRASLAEELCLRGFDALPTESQVALAAKLRLRQLPRSRAAVASAIEAELTRRNEAAMRKHRFTAGMQVRFVGGPSVYDLPWSIGHEFVVSSVHRRGRVYFRNTTGGFAYASHLEPA